MWSDGIGDTQLHAAYNSLADAQSIVMTNNAETDLQNLAMAGNSWSDSHITDLDLHRIASEAEENHLKRKRLERGKQPRMYSYI